MFSKVEHSFESLEINKKAEEIFEKEFIDFKNYIGDEEFKKFKYSISKSFFNNPAVEKIEKTKFLLENLRNNDFIINPTTLFNITLYNTDLNNSYLENYQTQVPSISMGNLLLKNDFNNKKLPFIINVGSYS